MAHNAIFHQGLHCLDFKEINTYLIETLTSNHLKYKQDSSTLSVPLEYKEFI